MTTPTTANPSHDPVQTTFGHIQVEGPGSSRDHRSAAITPALPTIPEQRESASRSTPTSQTLTPGQEWLPRPDSNSVYQAVDPYKISIAHYVNPRRPKRRMEEYPSLVTSEPSPVDDGGDAEPSAFRYGRFFVTHTLPRQIYLHILLRLPSMYWSRVARIFEDAEMSLPDIAQMITGAAHMKPRVGQGEPSAPGMTGRSSIGIPQKQHSVFTLSSFEPGTIPSTFLRLTKTWENFIDSMLKEWKILNIVSVLLLSAILATLQIESALAEPITRTAALMSLVSALMSLLYGCMYSIRFYDMRKPHKAAQWAQEAQRKQSHLFWNVWVFLAMPAVWLAWSIVAYIVCVMAYVWRTGPGNTPPSISQKALLGSRVAISVVMFMGIVYFVFILMTLKRYGDPMDQQWHSRALKWTEEAKEKLTDVGRNRGPPRRHDRPNPNPSHQAPGYASAADYQAWLSDSSRYHESPAANMSHPSRSAPTTPWSQGHAAMIPPGVIPHFVPWTTGGPPPTPRSRGNIPLDYSGWTPTHGSQFIARPTGFDTTPGRTPPSGSSVIYPTPNPHPAPILPNFLPQPQPPLDWGMRMQHVSGWNSQGQLHPGESWFSEHPNKPVIPISPFIPPPLSSASTGSAASALNSERHDVNSVHSPPIIPPTTSRIDSQREPGTSGATSDFRPVHGRDENAIIPILRAGDVANANSDESKSLPEPAGFTRMPPAELGTTPFLGVKIMEISLSRILTSREVPACVTDRDITQEDWSNFVMDVDELFPHNPDIRFTSAYLVEEYPGLLKYLQLWNTKFFIHRKTCVVLCSDKSHDLLKPTHFSLYLFDLSQSIPSKEPSADTHQVDELEMVELPTKGERALPLFPEFSSGPPTVHFSPYATLISTFSSNTPGVDGE